MTQNKRKKVRTYRGSKTHGGGSMKKRRGAGHRGGRGRAGSGKRGDARKPSFWKSWKMGNHGFTSIHSDAVETMNVSDLSEDLDLLVEAGHGSAKGGAYTIDLTKAGVDKLLGSGQISAKVDVTVEAASKRAVEKIEAAGGSVTVSEESSSEDEE